LSAGSGFGFVEESCFRAKVKAEEYQDRQPPGEIRLQGLGSRPFPIEGNHSMESFNRNGIAQNQSVAAGPWRKVWHHFTELL
jgi:hypothetical protein